MSPSDHVQQQIEISRTMDAQRIELMHKRRVLLAELKRMDDEINYLTEKHLKQVDKIIRSKDIFAAQLRKEQNSG